MIVEDRSISRKHATLTVDLLDADAVVGPPTPPAVHLKEFSRYGYDGPPPAPRGKPAGCHALPAPWPFCLAHPPRPRGALSTLASRDARSTYNAARRGGGGGARSGSIDHSRRMVRARGGGALRAYRPASVVEVNVEPQRNERGEGREVW